MTPPETPADAHRVACESNALLRQIVQNMRDADAAARPAALDHRWDGFPPFAAASFDEVARALRAERHYQRRRWGARLTGVTGPVSTTTLDGLGTRGAEPASGDVFTDVPKSVGDYLTYMRHYLAEAGRLLATTAGTEAARDFVRKATALGVACLEVHGCPARDPDAPVVNGRDGQPA